jgi:hypothetical protein
VGVGAPRALSPAPASNTLPGAAGVCACFVVLPWLPDGHDEEAGARCRRSCVGAQWDAQQDLVLPGYASSRTRPTNHRPVPFSMLEGTALGTFTDSHYLLGRTSWLLAQKNRAPMVTQKPHFIKNTTTDKKIVSSQHPPN